MRINKTKLKTITMSHELVADLLKIKNDVNIRDIRLNGFGNNIEVLVESDKFASLSEAQKPCEASFEEVFQNDKLYTRIIKSKLSFEEALVALKQGCCVTRQIWDGYWRYEMVDCFEDAMIVAYLKGTGKKVYAQPNQCDILATDWMIVE